MPTIEELLHRPGPGSHAGSLTIAGQVVETLVDLPPAPGGLLFIGLNPSPISVAAGHYHQGTLGRRFWARLERAGIIPAPTPDADADDALVAAGHGLSDLLKTPSPRDVATDAELRAGVGPLWQKVALWRPGAVVFIYRRAASIAAGRTLGVAWGQLDGVALGGRPCFLMPGPYAPTKEVDGGLNLLRNLAATVAEVADR